MSKTSQATMGTNLPGPPTSEHPCPNCGHCPTCGRSNQRWPNPWTWPYGRWPNGPYWYWQTHSGGMKQMSGGTSSQSGLSYASNIPVSGS